MTRLDTAYAEAMKNEANQSAFYDAFLNSQLYIPTHTDDRESNARGRAEQGESIAPFFVESEGVQYLMLFDSEQRLSAWAQREVGFVVVPGHAVVEMMSPEIHWVLNVGTKFAKTFVPDEIRWLKQSVLDSKGKEGSVPVGTRAVVGAPASIPEGLIDSLQSTLARNREVASAYLGEVHYLADGEVPHLVLVIEVGDLPRSAVDAIRNDLATAVRGHIGKSEYIDIMLGSDSAVSREVVGTVEPFYVSKK